MNIGEASKLSGLPPKTIRYYETIKLVEPAKRSENGYRDYSENDIEQLQFLQRARTTGFNIDECRQLLDLFNNTELQSVHVKALVEEKAAHVAKQIEELKAMHQCLVQLANSCQSDEQPHCAIIDSLSQNAPAQHSENTRKEV